MEHDAEVVDGSETVEEEFAGFTEMMEIGPGVILASIAVTVVGNWLLVEFVFGLININALVW